MEHARSDIIRKQSDMVTTLLPLSGVIAQLRPANVTEEATMVHQSRVMQWMFLASLPFAFSAPLSARETCSDDEVRALLDKGNTVASIARKCDMDKEDVQFIQEEHQSHPDGGDDQGPDVDRLSSGTPVGQCGCWGYVDPGYRQPHQRCESGVAVPRMCNAMCPAGGYQWQGVCE